MQSLQAMGRALRGSRAYSVLAYILSRRRGRTQDDRGKEGAASAKADGRGLLSSDISLQED